VVQEPEPRPEAGSLPGRGGWLCHHASISQLEPALPPLRPAKRSAAQHSAAALQLATTLTPTTTHMLSITVVCFCDYWLESSRSERHLLTHGCTRRSITCAGSEWRRPFLLLQQPPPVHQAGRPRQLRDSGGRRWEQGHTTETPPRHPGGSISHCFHCSCAARASPLSCTPTQLAACRLALGPPLSHPTVTRFICCDHLPHYTCLYTCIYLPFSPAAVAATSEHRFLPGLCLCARVPIL
jgi:hypothetical protein